MASTDSRVGSDFEAGSRIASYLIAEEIGRGGMAIVYRARDFRLDRWVALKILTRDVARNSAFRQRFIRESRAAAAVDHPHIIPIFDAGEADGCLYIAMRYVSDRDVRSLIGRVGPLPLPRAVNITAQVASALDAAHACGLVHRDVKPANMLLGSVAENDAADHVYLSDFGISKLAGEVSAEVSGTGDRGVPAGPGVSRQADAASRLTATGDWLGTVHYAAPEQVQGLPVDGRADVYSLACAVFEMLAGEPPPVTARRGPAGELAGAAAPAQALSGWRPDLPPAVGQVLARALAVIPDDRYGSCRALAVALADASGLGVSQLPDGLAGPEAGPAARSPVPVAPGQAGRPSGVPAALPGVPPSRRPRRRLDVAAACMAVLVLTGGALLLHVTAHPAHSAHPVQSAQSAPSARAASASVPAARAGVAAGPAATVVSYIRAVNRRDYAEAWRLGGARTGITYRRFVARYASTRRDHLRIVSVSGDVVRADLATVLTDGMVRHARGGFIVQHGVIVAMYLVSYAGASATPVATPSPAGAAGRRNAASCPTIATAGISAGCYTGSGGTITITGTADPSPAGVQPNQAARLSNGHYLEYPGIDFGSGSSHFTARVASGAPRYASGGVEVVLDNPANPPVAGFSLGNTGGWDSWKTVGSNMTEVTGIHNVYIVLASGGPAPYMSLHYFTFAGP